MTDRGGCTGVSAPAQDVEVTALLGEMTLEEKLAQLGCVRAETLLQDGAFSPERAAQAIPHGIGQVTRIGGATELTPEASARLVNAIQEWLRTSTRLGIPAVVHEEAAGGYCARGATVFPQALGQAASWNPSLVQRIASVIREQMLAVGARHALAPVLDIARDPRWGRVEETYGEDPVLAGTLGTAFVRGLQTDDPRGGVAATGKHFLAHGISEGGRNHAPVNVGPRELRDVYAEPFAAAIREAGLLSVMNSYSSIDGLPCAGSRRILTDLLRGELGFEGVVVADYYAIGLLERHHHVAADEREAGRRALLAGMDMELPVADCFGAPLAQDIAAGNTPLAAVETAVERVLVYKRRLGVFAAEPVEPARVSEVFDTPRQRRLARRAAAESIVLLSNAGILPLRNVRRLAVLGPAAHDIRLLQGDYHYPAHQEMLYERSDGETSVHADAHVDMLPGNVRSPLSGAHYTPHVTPLDGLRAAVGAPTEVTYEAGCTVSGEDRSGLEAAEALARRADVAVLVLGGRSGLRPSSTVGEARDATDLRLTGVQEELAQRVIRTGTPSVVVVMSGRVHELTALAPAAEALVWLCPPGEEGGNALADVLLGRADPSGRLPVTLPRAVGQVPVHSGHRAGGFTAEFFGEYTDSPVAPLFAFGHGLSYASFAYDDFDVTGSTTDDVVVASVSVTNRSERDGVEVVQLYASDLVASVARPEQQLVGFLKLPIPAGERRLIRFTVHPSRLAFRDEDVRLVVEPGEFRFSVGASSRDIRACRELSLGGAVRQCTPPEIIASRVEWRAGDDEPWSSR